MVAFLFLAEGTLASEPYPLGPFPQEIIIQGPVQDLQFLVNDQNIFEPVHFQEGLSDQLKAEHIFAFARDKFLPWDAQVSMPLDALLYGYGFGFCGEQARTMASLLYQHGIPARMISIKHHVVLEGQVDGQWQLYDPQHRISYYQLYQRPVSFHQLRHGDALFPEGLDTVGVHWSHTRWVFETGTPQYSDVAWTLPAPRFELSTNQTLTIRPRQTNEFHALPIVYHRRPAYQTNQIPYHLMEINHHFDRDELAIFPKGLPILKAEFVGALPDVITINGERVSVDPNQIEQALMGEPKAVEIAMSKGSSFKLTYALAGWIGERLFSAGPDALLQTAPALAPNQVTIKTSARLPRLWIESVEVPQKAKYQTEYEVAVTLVWADISGDQHLEFELRVDELKSDIALEYLAALPAQRFTWSSKQHGSKGRETIRLSWMPVEEKAPAVPDTFRILVAQVSGPHVRAGGALTQTFKLPTKPVP